MGSSSCNWLWEAEKGKEKVLGTRGGRGAEARAETGAITVAGCWMLPASGFWLKLLGLKLLLTSNRAKATYWLNKFNWQQQQ